MLAFSMLLAGSGIARAETVGACSGVSLPRSVVTDIMGDVLVPVIQPLESLLGTLTLGTVNLGLGNSLSSAAGGAPIDLGATDINGGPVDLLTDPGCNSQADSYGLSTPKGLSIGGNQITGLGQSGFSASAGELDAIAIGDQAYTAVGANGAIALGKGASSTHAGSVALGAGSVANGSTLGASAYLVGGSAAAEVNIGSRRLTGLAAGAEATDAVNVAQLSVVNNAVTQLSYDVSALDSLAVKYQDSSKSAVALGGASGTRITNVAAGAVAAGSSDAINGGQLAASNASIAAHLGGGSVVEADGTLSAPQYALATVGLDGSTGTATYNNVGDALGSLSTSIDNVNQRIGAVEAVSQRAVTYDDADRDSVTFAGANGTRLSNVQAGEVSADSTDAVNGAQLYATNMQVAANSTVVNNLRQGRAGYLQVNNSSGYAEPVASGADTLAAGGGAVASGDRSLALGAQAQAVATNSVALGHASVADRANSVSVGSAGAERSLTNVADGVSPTDAVNMRQLQGGMGEAVASANDYTDRKFGQINADIYALRREARAGTASAMALSAIPQPLDAGSNVVGFSGWQGEGAVALGISRASDNGRFMLRAGATYNSRNQGGANAGVGFAF